MSALLSAPQVWLSEQCRFKFLWVSEVWESFPTSRDGGQAGYSRYSTKLCGRNLCKIWLNQWLYYFTFYLYYLQEIGCLIGALSNLWIGDKLGRKRTIVLGGVLMIFGAILQTASYGYAQMVIARIVTGLGNGLNVRHNTFQRTFLSSNDGYDHRRRLCPRTMPNVPQPQDVVVLSWSKEVSLHLALCFRAYLVLSCTIDLVLI